MKNENLQAIENDDDLQKALAQIDKLWGAKVGTPQGKALDDLIKLVESYENISYPMPS